MPKKTVITVLDNFANAYMKGLPLPKLKGTATFTLTDVKTGAREKIVQSNMITDAIAKIFELNFLGMANFQSIIPIRQLLGGCMLFASPLTESVNTIFPPNSSANNMVARCGQTPHATPDPTRGNPAAPEISGDHIKLIFDWNQDQGNGTISAVTLTHQLAGDVGIKPDGTGALLLDYGFTRNQFNMFSGYTLGDNTMTRERAMALPVSIDSDGNGISLLLTATTLEEITVAHSFIKGNLLESSILYPFTNFRELSSRTATLSRTFAPQYTKIAQDANYYYVIERDSGSATTLYIDVIDKTDFTSVTPTTLSVSGVTLARTANDYGAAGIFTGIVSGGYVYHVSGSDAKTFVRINMSNPADVDELATSMVNNIQLYQSNFELSAGLILGANFIINGDRVYPVARRAAKTDISGSPSENVAFDLLASANGGPAVLQSGYQDYDATYYNSTQGGMIVLPYCASVCNLDTPVTKNQSKTMRLEYVITQV